MHSENENVRGKPAEQVRTMENVLTIRQDYVELTVGAEGAYVLILRNPTDYTELKEGDYDAVEIAKPQADGRTLYTLVRLARVAVIDLVR